MHIVPTATLTRRGLGTLAVGAGLGLATACAAPSSPSGAPSTQPSDQPSTTALVIADSTEADRFNILDGRAQYGVSPIYDGLLQFRATTSDEAPALEPALAAELPSHSADATVWTVKLRQGVTFSDGSAFDADDVVATYENILDPKVGSSIASDLDMVKSVKALDAHTVEFTLKYPYAEFDSMLLLGIAPAEQLTHVSVDRSPLNTKPIGTGPYKVERMSADEAVLVANPTHWRGRPSPERWTIVQLADDNTRAQRMSAGEVDGAVLPPTLAKALVAKGGAKLVSVRTVDARYVVLPKDNPFTSERAARLAMNEAVNRQAMVDKVLAGEGAAQYTPIPAGLGALSDTRATFTHDPEAAKARLDAAGWVVGGDGVRAKGGQRAAFTVFFPAGDALRQQLATAFAADMQRIGVEVTIEGSTWDKIEPQVSANGLLGGDGRHPTSMDALVYAPLHRRDASTSSPYTNSGDQGSAQLDALLEKARREIVPARRTELYRQVQQHYVTDPGYVFLVNLRHTYVAKSSAAMSASTIVEPHIHSAAWGPWWNLGKQ